MTNEQNEEVCDATKMIVAQSMTNKKKLNSSKSD